MLEIRFIHFCFLRPNLNNDLEREQPRSSPTARCCVRGVVRPIGRSHSAAAHGPPGLASILLLAPQASTFYYPPNPRTLPSPLPPRAAPFPPRSQRPPRQTQSHTRAVAHNPRRGPRPAPIQRHTAPNRTAPKMVGPSLRAAAGPQTAAAPPSIPCTRLMTSLA